MHTRARVHAQLLLEKAPKKYEEGLASTLTLVCSLAVAWRVLSLGDSLQSLPSSPLQANSACAAAPTGTV